MRFSLTPSEITHGIRVLTDIISKSDAGINGNPPQLLLIAPPIVKTTRNFSKFSEEFEKGEEKSVKFGEYYREVAEEYVCKFLDASLIVSASDLDGIHLDEKAHIDLGHEIARIVKTML